MQKDQSTGGRRMPAGRGGRALGHVAICLIFAAAAAAEGKRRGRNLALARLCERASFDHPRSDMVQFWHVPKSRSREGAVPATRQVSPASRVCGWWRGTPPETGNGLATRLV